MGLVKMLKLYKNYIRNYESDENLLKLYNFYIKIIYKLNFNFFSGNQCASNPLFYIKIIYEKRSNDVGFYIIIIYIVTISKVVSKVKKINFNFYISKNYIIFGRKLPWQ